MNNAVDLNRDKTSKPDSCDFDLVEMLKKMYAGGINLQACGTCNARCGFHKMSPTLMKRYLPLCRFLLIVLL